MQKSHCTACGLCVAVCPVDAIRIQTRNMTERVAIVNEKKCIHCGKCTSVCPQIDVRQVWYQPIKCYAAWSKTFSTRGQCSSAGAITEIGRAFVERGGEFIALSFTSNGQLRYKVYRNVQSINNMPGSIYAYIEMGRKLYTYIDKKTNQGIPILIVGLPCQIDGIRRFVRNHENLYTIDLICSGCPSKTVLYKYLTPLGKYSKITFRGRYNFKLSVFDDTKLIYQKPYSEDQYCRMFNQGIGYRERCYVCPYAQEKRVGDLTIGDFWGLGASAHIPFQRDNGINVVLINSENGEKLFRDACLYLDVIERPVQEAINGNARLRKPASNNYVNTIYKLLVRCLGIKMSFKIALWINERSKK